MNRPMHHSAAGGRRSWRRALTGLLVCLAVASFAQADAAASYRGYNAYRSSVARAGFVGADPHDPRLLNDAQFAGRLDDASTLLGVYYGNQGWKMQQVRDMESWQAKKFAVVHLYTSWCDSPGVMDELFERQLAGIWENHNVPLVSWELFLCSPAQTPPNVEVLAAQGRYDAYLTRWFDRLRSYLSGDDGVYNTRDDRRLYLRPAHEMNGDWLPWSAAAGNNEPADYVRMWRRTREIAGRHGLDQSHVQWLWSVNHTDNGGFRAEQYYPGDEYVDWLAISGYNWGETQSWSSWSPPEQVFGPMLGRLRAIASKPVAIPEYASSSRTVSGPDAAAKSRWIASVHDYALAHDIRLLAWFNQDKETDWAVFGGSGGDGSYAGTGTPFVPPRGWPVQPSQIVAAALLAAFVAAQASFVVRRLRRGKQL